MLQNESLRQECQLFSKMVVGPSRIPATPDKKRNLTT